MNAESTSTPRPDRADETPVIEGKALALGFSGRCLFENLRIAVSDGNVLGLIGPSGCGKTSVGKILCGMHKADSGEVRVNGIDLDLVDPADVPIMNWQTASLFDHLNVRQNIELGTKIRRVPENLARSRSDDLVERLGLSAVVDAYPARLSGGERARVALARTFAVDPKIVILDEPFANLDVLSRDAALSLIRARMNRPDRATILISHSITDAADLCHQILVLDRNRPLAAVNPDQLIHQPRSAFEAHFTGRWGIVGATIDAISDRVVRCNTVHGKVEARLAHWLADWEPKIGERIAIIDDQNSIQSARTVGVKEGTKIAIPE